jgi:hypothetical protein
VIGRCSLVPTSHLDAGKCTRFILSQAAPVWFYRIAAGFLYAFIKISREQNKIFSSIFFIN